MDALEVQTTLTINLARHNINITHISDEFVFYDFSFKLRNGSSRWAKAVYRRAPQDTSLIRAVEDIMEIVRATRMEVEENEWR